MPTPSTNDRAYTPLIREYKEHRARARKAGRKTVDSRRPKQHAPKGDWRIWLLHPGRAWGKGFTAAHWLRDRVVGGHARRIALVGSTNRHVRQVMIEDPLSGILKVCPDAVYRRSDAEVIWPNGAKAYVCSAENADKPPLRGGNFDTAWPDEVDSWGLETTNEKATTAWDNLTLSVRLGDARIIVTSTPKPGRIVAGLLVRARDEGDVVVTTGSTYENAANLSPQFIKDIERRFKGTRLERREIYGEVPEDVADSLWPPGVFHHRRVKADQCLRVAVGVDPSGGGDAIGIVAAGQLTPELFVVLDDWTTTGSPAKWARRTKELAEKWRADVVVAERNYGGDMVLSTLKAASTQMPVRMVTASRGKHIRAEPIALLYEQKKITHRSGDAALDLLEEEQRFMTTTGYVGEGSPNRADAAVWALTELTKPRKTWGVA